MSQKSGDVTTYFSYDSAGKSVVQYQYDSWGKLIGITGNLANTIGKRNLFRYRGYYYDDETGMYYLQSRYYDPEIKRFICADDTKVLQEKTDLYNKNLYAYCDNNPIIKKDATGEVGFWWGAIAEVSSPFCGKTL